MTKKLVGLVSGVMALALTPSVQAADGSSAEQALAGSPRIGLELGGGGARGAAHIGVIRRLEELHIPVVVIAGTSMGSLVGGFYASGMTA